MSAVLVSNAQQRWRLLSRHIQSLTVQFRDHPGSVQADFIVFEPIYSSKISRTGRWYRLKSPVGNFQFDIHIYSLNVITLNDLVGFDNTGNVKLWPSEECLAYFLLKHENLVRGKIILELGAGMVGLSGLTAAALGAEEVILTDGNKKSVENAQKIVKENKLSDRVSCCLLPWKLTLPNKLFDVILCADCLFFTEEHRNLLNCTYEHLKPWGVAYFMAPDRGGTAKAFLELLYEERERWQGYSVNFHIEEEAEICSRLKLHGVRSQAPLLIILKK